MRYLLLAVGLLSGCTFDEDPGLYIETLKPDLFFALPMLPGTPAANIWFTTIRPKTPTLPVNIRVLTWSNEGGSIFNDTLGDVTLDSPVQDGKLLRWSGAAGFPASGVADKIAVELRTFLPIAAFSGRPLDGTYCEVEFDGRGILACGEWIEAFIRL